MGKIKHNKYSLERKTMTNSLLLASAKSNNNKDPYWANVVSLLHFDGSNGSTNFVDQVSGNTWTASSATISTTEAKFGTSSGYFNGGSAIYTGASTNWTFSGEFTMEGWVYFLNLATNNASLSPSNQYIFDIGANGTYLRILTSGYSGSPNGWTLYQYITADMNYSTVPVVNQWYYWVLQRNSANLLSLYLNGSLVASTTLSSTLGSDSTLTLGNYTSGESYGLNGYMDEVRITNGVARYSGSTIPIPTAPFPNS
jgi:hypothetical protein